MKASAPAITGSHEGIEGDGNPTGCFYKGAAATEDKAAAGIGDYKIMFNASRCSSIYGASSTIRPISRRTRFMIRF